MAVSMMAATVRKLTTLAEVLAAIVGGLAASQFANFTHHYVQNLAGRLDEARRDVAAIAERAAAVGLSVEAYVREFLGAASAVFRSEGAALQAKLSRAEALEAAYAALREAGWLERPVVLLTHFQAEIARDAWRHYEPAAPLDAASLFYAACGAVLALLVLWAAKSLLLVPLHLMRRVRGRQAGA